MGVFAYTNRLTNFPKTSIATHISQGTLFTRREHGIFCWKFPFSFFSCDCCMACSGRVACQKSSPCFKFCGELRCISLFDLLIFPDSCEVYFYDVGPSSSTKHHRSFSQHYLKTMLEFLHSHIWYSSDFILYMFWVHSYLFFYCIFCETTSSVWLSSMTVKCYF